MQSGERRSAAGPRKAEGWAGILSFFQIRSFGFTGTRGDQETCEYIEGFYSLRGLQIENSVCPCWC